MAALDVAGYSKVLRTLYNDETNPKLLYPEHPLVGRMKKVTKFGGNNKRINCTVAPGGGGSHNFEDAQLNKSAGTYAAFFLTRAKDYSLFSVDTEALLVSQGDDAATLEALKSAGDLAMYVAGRALSRNVWGNRGSSLGQVGSVSGTVLTLLNPEHIVNFEPNMVIVSSDTSGSDGTTTTDGEAIVITAVDRDLGTITKAGAAWTANGNFANSDYLFREGDKGRGMSGVDDWVPSAAPGGGDSFFSQNRSVDTRLSGVRVTADPSVDGTYENALSRAAALCQRHGGRPTEIYMNPVWTQKLEAQLGDKRRYTTLTAKGEGGKSLAEIGYDALILKTAQGDMPVLSDPDCPPGLAYMLRIDSWALHSVGSACRWFDFDGGRMLREPNADALEGRLFTFGNVATSMPHANARVNLAPLET